MIIKTLYKLFDFFIPDKNKNDKDYLNKSRLLIGAHFISLVFILPFSILYLIVKYEWGLNALSIIFFIILIDLFIFKKIGSCILSGNLIIFGGFVGFLIFIITGGGIYSPTVPWLIAVALTGFLFANRTSGFIWSTLALLTILSFYIADIICIKFEKLYPSEANIHHFGFSLFGVSLYIVLIVLIYEFSKSLKNKEITEVLNSIKENNEELLQQQEEIITQHNEINVQKEKLNNKNSEIISSIIYAERIQNAVLPSDNELNKAFNDHFVLYMPRDIVSGDFYWFYQRRNTIVLVAADCTGHGVPGAFLSMLGMSFLKDIVSNVIKTGRRKDIPIQASEILEQLQDNITNSFKQTGRSRSLKDGMDIAVCIIDKNTKEMSYSGAHNPVIIVRNNPIPEENKEKLVSDKKIHIIQNHNEDSNNSSTLIEIKPDKIPIGFHRKFNLFTEHRIQLEKNDSLYLFSDGYNDQIGGKNGRKFLIKNFKQLLLNIQNLNMNEQKETLIKQFEDRLEYISPAGNSYKQTDDILVMGIKI